MPTIYIDADACPVKEETYRVARRLGFAVKVVANAPLRIPTDASISLVVCPGFGAADDHIAAVIQPGDIAITADVPLAARCVSAGGRVLDPRGRELKDNNVGAALATRDLMDELRQGGTITGGPAPMTPRDRSKFLGKLDELCQAVLRERK